MIHDDMTGEIRTVDADGMLFRLIECTAEEFGDNGGETGHSVRYFKTEDGEPVEQISDHTFRIVRSQRVLSRIEPL